MRGIETSGGRVSAVVTERGTIACQRVILAGGAWSRLFLGNLGIDFPQLKVLGSVLRTEPLEVSIDPLVQLLSVDSALVSTQVGAEKTGDHGCAVGSKQLPRRIALR